MSEIYPEITQLASTARAQRLTGDHHHGTSSDFPLVGYCFDNAYVAFNIFNAKGFDVELIEGTTERVADPLYSSGIDPRELDSVEKLAGHVHYWLTVQQKDKSAVVDIASDSYDTLGKSIVAYTLPDDYIELPDSRIEGNKTLNMVEKEGIRCRFCGDHRYTPGGCPDCKRIVSPDLVD